MHALACVMCLTIVAMIRLMLVTDFVVDKRSLCMYVISECLESDLWLTSLPHACEWIGLSTERPLQQQPLANIHVAMPIHDSKKRRFYVGMVKNI